MELICVVPLLIYLFLQNTGFIIKVPEHHHYFHEKEKIIQIEKPKEEVHYPPLKEEEVGDFDEHQHALSDSWGGHSHNIFKKHVSSTTVIPKKVKKQEEKEDSSRKRRKDREAREV
ncbi:unnamed protein product [Callosobruchus maculatus]|uniref:Uncharacterized protein n=1 Tax=Callosobruchus maculatus TaxID=64391 RepID=A0A653CCG8_CALMS|nr:unnamed protein product [Callosobruchus maculatus]